MDSFLLLLCMSSNFDWILDIVNSVLFCGLFCSVPLNNVVLTSNSQPSHLRIILILQGFVFKSLIVLTLGQGQPSVKVCHLCLPNALAGCSSCQNLKISILHVIAVNRFAYSSGFCFFLAFSRNFTSLTFGFGVQPGICGTTVKSLRTISLVNFLFTCASLNVKFRLVHLCLLQEVRLLSVVRGSLHCGREVAAWHKSRVVIDGISFVSLPGAHNPFLCIVQFLKNSCFVIFCPMFYLFTVGPSCSIMAGRLIVLLYNS